MRQLVVCSLGFAALISGEAAADAFDDAVSCHSLLAVGAYQEAIASCEAALETATLSEANIAVTANNLGRARLKLGDAKKAEVDFSRAIAADETNAHAVNNRGISRAAQGEFEMALVDFDRAIMIDADYLNAHFNRSKLRLDSGDPYGALEDVTIVLSKRPNLAAALSLRGDVLATLGLPNSTVVTADNVAEPKSDAELKDADIKQVAVAAPEVVAVAAPAPAAAPVQAPSAAPAPVAVVPEADDTQTTVKDVPFPAYAATLEVVAGSADMSMPDIEKYSAISEPKLAAIAPIDRPTLDMAPLAALAEPDLPLSPVDTYAGVAIRQAKPDAAPELETAASQELVTAIVASQRSAPAMPQVQAPAPVAVVSRAADRATVEDFEAAFKDGLVSVASTQQALKDLGYRPGPVDGLYGRQTRQALKACLAKNCSLSR